MTRHSPARAVPGNLLASVMSDAVSYAIDHVRNGGLPFVGRLGLRLPSLLRSARPRRPGPRRLGSTDARPPRL